MKKSKSEDNIFDDEDDYYDLEENEINTLSDLNSKSDSYSYGDDIENMNEEDKRAIEREIKAIMDKNSEDIDINGLLEGSNMEGISLNSFNSKSSGDIDMDEY